MIEAFGKQYDDEDAFAFALYSEAMRSYDLNLEPSDADVDRVARFVANRHTISDKIHSLAVIIASEVFAGRMNAEGSMAFFQDLFSK